MNKYKFVTSGRICAPDISVEWNADRVLQVTSFRGGGMQLDDVQCRQLYALLSFYCTGRIPMDDSDEVS
jgi:hypothetical protein